MALKQKVTIPAGINIANAKDDMNIETLILKVSYELIDAYVEIFNTTNNKGRITLDIAVKKERGGKMIYPLSYEFDGDTSDTALNDTKQGYIWLKENVFIDAIDVLEEGQTA
ncbi:hypothetical protein [Clostridium sp.]|uniref:hypothetical protein n=1 Tax=Clostridium sp. TaxID=1506 RepID=UPI0029000550|nr:hypothetical protein [Clostridium sp.]MDU2155776.1 hypothetical protein [Clostridium sp.]